MSKCNILFKFTIIFLGTCSIYANPEVAVNNQQPIQTIPNIVPKQNNNNNTVLVNNNQVSNNNINQRVNNNKIAQPNKKLVVYNRAMNNKEFINRLNKEYRSKNLIYKANEQILKNIKKLPPNPIPYKERKEKEMKELQQSIETDNINTIKRNNPTEYKQFVNHLTDVGASYNTNVSNSSEVAMANQKLLAQQNKIQVSPETKVLQFTEQQIKNLISNIRSKLKEIANAKDKHACHKAYKQLCKIFYDLWMLQISKETSIKTYMDIWKEDNINYKTLTDIWKTACTEEYYTIVINKLRELFDHPNFLRYKIRLSDIRILIRYYRGLLLPVACQELEANQIDEMIKTNKISDLYVQIQTIDKYLGLNMSKIGLTEEQIQEQKNVQREIAHQAPKVRSTLKTVGQLKMNDKKVGNHNFEKKNNMAPVVVKKEMVKENVMDEKTQGDHQNSIYLLLQDLEKSSNIDAFNKNYSKLCKYCYENIWQNCRKHKPDNYSNLDDIWNINSINYQLIQKIWYEAFSNHANNIFNTLSTLYEGDEYINYKVNKTIDKLQDIRYLIQDYILYKMKRGININTVYIKDNK